MINLMCLTCKNWETEKCDRCLSINRTKKPLKPQDIEFKNYRETPITVKEYQKRTGKKWAKDSNVYVKMISVYSDSKDIKNQNWRPMSYYDAITEGYPIVCALTPKRPPKQWLPKGYVLGSKKLH